MQNIVVRMGKAIFYQVLILITSPLFPIKTTLLLKNDSFFMKLVYANINLRRQPSMKTNDNVVK